MPLSAEALQTWSRFAVIAGDTTSGLFSPDVPAISACDRWLSARENSGQPLQHMAPDVVITFGAPLVSRRLREALAALDFEHFHVEVSGGAPAAFSRAPQPVPCDISEAIEAGAAAIQPHLPPERNPELDAWQRNWWDQEAALRKAHNTAVDAAPWSDLRAHRCLHRHLRYFWPCTSPWLWKPRWRHPLPLDFKPSLSCYRLSSRLLAHGRSAGWMPTQKVCFCSQMTGHSLSWRFAQAP